MVSVNEVDRQLKRIGVSFWFLGAAEVRQLRHILVDGETIEHCVLGRYDGGIAVLCATDLRLLLVDKKPFYLTVEDVRYDMVVEVDFSYRLIDSTIRVCTPNKTLVFRSYRRMELRAATVFVQQQVLAYRQQHVPGESTQFQASPTVQPTLSGWQPQSLIQPQATSDHPFMKKIAEIAIGEAGQAQTEQMPTTARVRQVINPYTRSSLMMRQRISRF